MPFLIDSKFDTSLATKAEWGFFFFLINSKFNTVGTPYNTNVGVQKIPDRAIWKPMVAKRNNTNPWSWLRPQILVTQDSGQPHMSKQPASRDWPEQIAPLVHSSQTASQLFNLGQSIEIRIPHLLGHVGQLHTKCISHIWLCFSVLQTTNLWLSGRITHAHS